MNHLQKHFSASLIALAALTAAPMAAWAASAPSLGTASSFAALSGAGLTCTGSALNGDVGSLLSVTGFPGYPAVLCTTTGTVHSADATAIAAHSDLFGASGTDSQLAAQACDYTFAGVTELSGSLIDTNGVAVTQPLSPGVYCFESAATLGGTLNLTSGGTYIFRTKSTLTTGATTGMAQVLINGAQATNCDQGIFWQIGSSATIGTNTALVGDVLANQSISFTGVNTSLIGGAFANAAAVTMTGTSISICGGTLPPPPTTCDGDHDGHDGDHDGHDGDHDGNNGHHDGHDKEHCDNGNHNGHDKDHEKCNQGVGNGSEGCDPGHSDKNPWSSNDEHGGKPGDPGRKGGNK